MHIRWCHLTRFIQFSFLTLLSLSSKLLTRMDFFYYLNWSMHFSIEGNFIPNGHRLSQAHNWSWTKHFPHFTNAVMMGFKEEKQTKYYWNYMLIRINNNKILFQYSMLSSLSLSFLVAFCSLLTWKCLLMWSGFFSGVLFTYLINPKPQWCLPYFLPHCIVFIAVRQ